MGRLGPLTSQALGRSPYDDVVEGEGEADPHEPERQYDDKGRVVNPETKRTIKNVIRAHNEVMLVIGVAEPENAGGKKDEDPLVKEHQAYEQDTGKTLLSLGRAITVFGIWGVHGFRQRVLLYRPYSHVEFSRLIHFERTRHSCVSIMFAGLPSFLTMQSLRWVTHSVTSFHERPLIQMGLSWCQFHLYLFVTMQRLGLVPASQWLPDIKFFVPFSSSSPIPPPPPVQSLSVASIGGWVSQLALNLTPYAALFLCGRIWHSLHCHMWPQIHKHLPRPLENERLAQLVLERQRSSNEAWETIPESPTLGAADREIRHTRNPDQDLPTLQALEGQVNGPEPGVPLEAIRRQSTFSSRGEQDYATDEEDSEMINPTLISFDVDTSEATEQPPGVWSAELRPSYGGDGRPMPREEPLYMVNPLTNLPSYLAADAFTNLATYILITPYEAFALRTVARAFARRRGLPVGDLFDVGTAGLVASLSWRGVGHVLGLEALRFLIGSEIWCLTAMASTYLHVSEEQWKGMRKEEEEEEEEAARQARPRSAS